MQLPPESDDELELSGQLPKPPRRRVERLVDEQRRLRHEEQLSKSRRTRLAQLQLEQDERDATARQQAEAEAQAIPTDPEFAAWLEGRHRGGRGASTPSNSDAAHLSGATDLSGVSDMDDIADYDLEDDASEAVASRPQADDAPARIPPSREVERRAQRAKQARRDWWKDAHTTAPASGATKGTSSLSSANFGNETIAEKRKAKSRTQRVLRRLAFASVLVLLAGGAYFCFTSPRFSVRNVTVQGRDITPSQPIERAQALLVGHNWARARTGEAQKLLQALPTVRQAKVARRLTWPPQIGIQIYERQPFARVGADRVWWVVDASGVPFRRVNDKAKTDRALLPLTGPQLIPHEGKPLPDNLWRAALKLVSVLKGSAAASITATEATEAPNASPATTDWSLRRIYFDRSGAVSLRLAGGSQDGLLVRLGNESWAHKLSMARQALAYFDATGRRAATLDLSSPDLPSLVSSKGTAPPLNRAIWTERAPQKEDSSSEDASTSGARTDAESSTRTR